MNKALKLVLMYLFFFIVLLIAGTFLNFFYLNLLNLVIGSKSSVNYVDSLILSFLYASSVLVLVMGPVIIYYRIRHISGIPQLISFILLSVVAWNLLLPSIFKLKNLYIQKYPHSENEKIITKDYFRTSDEKIFYFTDDLSNENNNPVAIVINPNEKESVQIERIENSPHYILYDNASPYSDLLIKNSFPSKLVNERYLSFSSIFIRGEQAFNKGFSYWLGFLSLALVICSVYGLSNFFEWRLMNTTLLLSSTFLILLFNLVYFFPIFLKFKIKYIQSKELFQFLSRFVDDPFLCVINVFTSFIFITIGIVNYFKNRKKI